MNSEALPLEGFFVVEQKMIDGVLLVVKETDQLRWFEYGGFSTQSMMNKHQPTQILTPVSRSLLLFLLFKQAPLSILNLGLGGAALERALVTIPNLTLTAVEASQSIIDMAANYFKLPKQVKVFCQKAEQYINQTTDIYDVVICDLFIGEKSPDFLFSSDFYEQIANITTEQAVLMINIQADTNQELFNALSAIKKQFPHIALVEFSDYSNIVLICSLQKIPDLSVQVKDTIELTQSILFDIESLLDKVIYINS